MAIYHVVQMVTNMNNSENGKKIMNNAGEFSDGYE